MSYIYKAISILKKNLKALYNEIMAKMTYTCIRVYKSEAL